MSKFLESVYSRWDGTVAILQAPEGYIPPPRIYDDLIYIGTPHDIITKLSYTMKQSEIATICGVGQQHISYWIAGKGDVRLSAETWQEVMKLYLTGKQTYDLSLAAEPERVKAS